MLLADDGFLRSCLEGKIGFPKPKEYPFLDPPLLFVRELA